MGGAVGHLQHLYDNRDLTFGEMKEILSLAAEGKLEKATEKLDGINLVFSWDSSSETLLAARNVGDIKRGGMNATELANKFYGRGNLEKAFNDAFRVLNGALSALSPSVKNKIFGSQASKWYSMEIIYSQNPNVINYDSNSIVFHGWPVFSVDKNGNIVRDETDNSGVDVLTANIKKMQKAVENSSWRVSGPLVARLEKISDGSIVDSTLSSISSAMSRAGMSDGNTVGDYIRSFLEEDVLDLDISQRAAEAVISRCMEDPYSPTLIDIKKMVDNSKYNAVKQFIENCPKHLKSYIQPIEYAINNFAVELLKGLKSTLIGDPDKEINRLRDEVSKAISAIEASNDENATEILTAQLQKLKSVENITSPVEGVVFIYKGNAYKFTGSFAAANQILGLFKYGRGKSKPLRTRS